MHPQATQLQSNRAMRVLVWICLGSAIALCATGEYHMAVEVGYDWRLAVFYPVALDAYAIAAFKVHRQLDTAVAIGLMIVCNSLSHLLSAGQIPESNELTIAVSAVPPLILWRVHELDAFLTKTMLKALFNPPVPAEATPAGVPAPAVAPPVPVPVVEPVAVPAPVAPVVPDSPAGLDGLAAPVEEPVRFPYGVAPTGIHQEDVWDVVVPLHRNHPRLSAPELKERFNLVPSIRTIQRVVKAAKGRDNVLIAV
ncbi:hypothetical protein [Glycomyces buryatensis]|uniref:DUF2637 domain-containing protein n=1 Tax=Glycomyces buryatensis TaxID=2570927 RepID=A0A4S8QEK8_9ACTN|nr:hypothetical protein [Glycomyces buryatensis]THV39659.1 hypothetical protein FAB82_17475 [Glycomyces buryatensis]